MRATITATSRFLPEKVLTNSDLEKLVDTTSEWILSRTGISERRIVENGEVTSHMGTKVSLELLEKTGIDPSEIDVIIVGTITPDMIFPSTACLIQNKIKAVNAWGFDLSAACSGFLFALEAGAKMIESGAYKKIIVIGAETMSSILNYEDRNTCILFGDGAGGVMLEPAKGDEGIIDSLLYSDGSGGDFLKMEAGGSLHPASIDTVEKRMHFLQQNGRKVYKFAVKGMAESSQAVLQRNNLSGKDLSLFIPHQANRRIIEASAERLGLRQDQILINIDRYANTTAGTIPIGISDAVDSGRLKQGDYVILTAFGAGFTWGSILVRWGNCK
ncbi:MAG: ketoacyl-ACP synthase III [Candidatus Marinimicrobia bacterium]|nr:ketoacyl-ACP synthase III [Candidatus Neomarinimicrobiota bacterium]MCH8068242.1 ketoacyl-ACP synthase III [Candidatus Neomarinimicrobiota bacterium]